MLATVSCNFEEDRLSFVDSENFYKTKAQCIAGLNSCYTPLTSIYTYTYMIVTECTTDLMWVSSGDQDAQMDITPARPRFGQTMWTQGYRGVMYCNAAIAGIERCPAIDDDTRNRLKAEGLVMRAYYYWLLTSTFGDVPFYTIDETTEEIQNEIRKMGRMPARDTRKYLIKELQEYVPCLDQIRACDVADNRSGAALGWHLIGKLAQWNGEWQTAIDALSHLEEIYGDLNQYKIEDNWFRYKNMPETIFEIQHTWSESGLKVYGNLAAMVHPKRTSGTMYDGVDIPEWSDQKTTWDGTMRPNAYFYIGLQKRNGNDLRTATNMAWEYNGQPFSNPASSGRPWMGPKFWNPECYLNQDGNNYKVFRYADALLMLAECYYELRDPANACKYLNMTRNRAGIGNYTYKTDSRLQEEIRNERARELIGEFQRKYDLVRWGVWFQQTYEYQDYSRVKDAMKPCHEYYPIPLSEIINSGYILDNKEYDKYGL